MAVNLIDWFYLANLTEGLQTYWLCCSQRSSVWKRRESLSLLFQGSILIQ